MKERGVIFNTEMVRATIDGRKTQTRRIMEPQPEPCPPPRGGHWWPSNVFKTMLHIEEEMQNGKGVWGGLVGDACPFGKVGDRLWVRETYSPDFSNYYPNQRFWYAADNDRKSDIEVVDGVRGIYSPESDVHVPFRWRPSIHMPRAASRILLEITDVRVERLNDISEEDAKAEGAPTECCVIGDKHFLGFRTLWKSIYGAESWDANPWCWVIEFKQIK